jgi:hypothetical protein
VATGWNLASRWNLDNRLPTLSLEHFRISLKSNLVARQLGRTKRTSIPIEVLGKQGDQRPVLKTNSVPQLMELVLQVVQAFLPTLTYLLH